MQPLSRSASLTTDDPYNWKPASSVPSSLRCVSQFHPRVEDVVSESKSIWEERGLLDGIDSSSLRSLQVNSCTELGFLLDSLLNKVSILQLKSLTISQSQSFGALGRDKLKLLLITNRGLQEFASSNLGQGRQCMRSNSAQSATLGVVKLHEPDVNDSKKLFVP